MDSTETHKRVLYRACVAVVVISVLYFGYYILRGVLS